MPSTTSTPSLGFCFQRHFPPTAVTEFARALESGGVDELWVIEDCFFTTAPPLAAAALAVTERLTVGLGIVPAVARTAAITAMEIATLAGLAPGRLVAGIGHGVQSWMEQMGVRPSSPLTTLDEVITAVRHLLAGNTVTVQGRTVTLDEVRLELPPTPVPPVVAGVRGPKSLELAGRVADGVLLDNPCSAPYLTWAREQCAAADDFQFRCFAWLSVDDDPRVAYRRMVPALAAQLRERTPMVKALPFHDDLAALFDRDGEDGLVGMPREWWHTLGAVGTQDDAEIYLDSLTSAGVTGVAFFPSADLEQARQQVANVSRLAVSR